MIKRFFGHTTSAKEQSRGTKPSPPSSPKVSGNPGSEHESRRTKGVPQNGQMIKSVPSYYTPSQINEWLSYIGYAEKGDNASGIPAPTLVNLEDLMRLQLLAFPFENTAMHYTSQHIMDVSHEGAFNRLVVEHKGSYCYGLNGVFLGMIRGLGYRAYPGAGRTSSKAVDPTFTALTHMVIFVQPHENSNQTYLVDVGFGPSGLARPILLSDASDNVIQGVNPTEKHRLTRKPHPSSSLETRDHPHLDHGDLYWNLEVWKSDAEEKNPWRSVFSFKEDEIFDNDIETSSFSVYAKPMGVFWDNVIAVRYALLSEIRDLQAETISQEGLDLADGKYTDDEKKKFMFRYVMIGKEVKRYIGKNGVTVRTMNTEAERLSALREIFGLNLPNDAQKYIEGRNAAYGRSIQ